MGGGLVDVLVLVLAFCGVGFALLTWWTSRKRAEGLLAWATTNRWTYAPTDHALVDFSDGQPFGVGHSKRVTEVLAGPYDGFAGLSFTYRWTTGSGKESTTHTAHVVALRLPAFLPTLELTPDGFGAKLAKLVGAQDLEFESDEFNKAYRVASADPRVAYAIVHPRLMERMLRDDARGSCWRIEGTWILTWASGTTDLDRLASRLGMLSAVVRSVPRHVWLDHGFDPLAAPA